jgi:transposase
MYSIDYRKRAVEYKQEGHTFEELYEVFRITSTTYYRWKGEYANGFEQPAAPRKRFRKIDRDELNRALEEKPDAYLRELAELFGCSIAAVHKMLVKMGVTYKKNIHIRRKI